MENSNEMANSNSLDEEGEILPRFCLEFLNLDQPCEKDLSKTDRSNDTSANDSCDKDTSKDQSGMMEEKIIFYPAQKYADEPVHWLNRSAENSTSSPQQTLDRSDTSLKKVLDEMNCSGSPTGFETRKLGDSLPTITISRTDSEASIDSPAPIKTKEASDLKPMENSNYQNAEQHVAKDTKKEIKVPKSCFLKAPIKLGKRTKRTNSDVGPHEKCNVAEELNELFESQQRQTAEPEKPQHIFISRNNTAGAKIGTNKKAEYLLPTESN